MRLRYLNRASLWWIDLFVKGALYTVRVHNIKGTASALYSIVNMSICSEFNYKIQAMQQTISVQLECDKKPKQCQTGNIQCLQQCSNPCSVIGETRAVSSGGDGRFTPLTQFLGDRDKIGLQ